MNDQTLPADKIALFADTESQGALLADALASGDETYIRLARLLIDRDGETQSSDP